MVTEDEAYDLAYEAGEKIAEDEFEENIENEIEIDWYGNTVVELVAKFRSTDVIFEIDLSDYFGNIYDAFQELEDFTTLSQYADIDGLKNNYMDNYASDYADEHADDYITSNNRRPARRTVRYKATPKVASKGLAAKMNVKRFGKKKPLAGPKAGRK